MTHREPAPAELPDRVQAPPLRAMRLYPYGLSQERLEQAAKGPATSGARRQRRRTVRRRVDAQELLSQASRRSSWMPNARGIPVYVLRSNTIAQMEGILEDLYGVDGGQPDPVDSALRETEAGIAQVQQGANSIELSPPKRLCPAPAARTDQAGQSVLAQPGQRTPASRADPTVRTSPVRKILRGRPPPPGGPPKSCSLESLCHL